MEDLQLLQADEVLAGQGGQLVPAQPQLLQQGQVGEGSVWHLVRRRLQALVTGGLAPGPGHCSAGPVSGGRTGL